jgi:methylenetetrahydrofolate reductase (NADPH)
MHKLTAQPTAGLVQALRRPRYEVLPTDGVDDEVAEHVPMDLPVTVTASPRRGLELTITLTERLRQHGYEAVPHIAARQIIDESHLTDLLARLDHAGVRDAFVVAGDCPVPMGRFADSLALLRAMERVGHRLERIGVAGYPGGHPFVAEAELLRFLTSKAPLATYIVSQLCFDSRVAAAWLPRVRAAGVILPVLLGVAGVVDRYRLLRIATKIGVGESSRFLRKHRGRMARLVLPRRYRPDRQVLELGAAMVMDGLHIYTFNNLRETELWRQRMLARIQRR